MDVIINSSFSDHNTLVVSSSFEVRKEGESVLNRNFYSTNIHRYNLEVADEDDWNRFSMVMDSRDWSSVNKHKVNGKIALLNANIEQSVHEIFPLKEVRKKGNKIPKFVQSLMKKKKKLSDRLMKTKSAPKLIEIQFELRTVEKRLAESLNNKTRCVEEKVISKLKENPAYFYSYAKSFS